MSRVAIAIVLVFMTAPAAGQDLGGFTKILLPAHTADFIHGVNGSIFRAELSGYTERDTVLFAGEGDPPQFVTQQAFNPILRVLNYGPARPTGRFLFVETTKAAELSLQYVLRSSDRAEETADQLTTLPVVRRPLSGRARILRIPVEPVITYAGTPPTGTLAGYRYRLMLRVYDWAGNGTTEIRVRRFVESLFGTYGELSPVTLRLDRRDGSDPTFAWYAELPLEHCLPLSARVPCYGFGMRVELEPLASDARYWGFVSVTDNRTQHVTILAPQ